jgi:hypothetical protein
MCGRSRPTAMPRLAPMSTLDDALGVALAGAVAAVRGKRRVAVVEGVGQVHGNNTTNFVIKRTDVWRFVGCACATYHYRMMHIPQRLESALMNDAEFRVLTTRLPAPLIAQREERRYALSMKAGYRISTRELVQVALERMLEERPQ